ncbi:MAG: RdgB/HAM1 family non-canonical purine NTP pyrophosphatase [Mucinivorans sp.]
MELIFATANKHKLEEISAVLGDQIVLRTLIDCGITQEIPETAATLEGNALQKARYVYEHTGSNCFADDTGLEVASLGGEPGVRSARYAPGLGHDSAANMALLLSRLAGKDDRSARFRTVIALIIDGMEYCVEGRVDGTIIFEPRGDGGFGYDPIFVPEGSDLTFAQMTNDEKNTISHRGRAAMAMRDLMARFVSNH